MNSIPLDRLKAMVANPGGLPRRRAVLIAGGLLALGAVAAGWPVLVAIGLAPLILAVAPCLVMCALGFCTMKACHKTEATPAVRDAAGTRSDPAAARPSPRDSLS